MHNLFKPFATLVAVLALTAALAGCVTTGVVAPSLHPNLTPPSKVAMADCLLPVGLPPGKMTQKDIEKYWGLDRAHQIDCAKRHKILADYISKRDAGLSGADK